MSMQTDGRLSHPLRGLIQSRDKALGFKVLKYNFGVYLDSKRYSREVPAG
jgi:hypothetical protein